MKQFLLLVFTLLNCSQVLADFTVNLDAGQLTSPLAAPMQIDDTLGSENGSLLLLLDLGSSTGTGSNILTAGNYVSGPDFVLAATGFNDFGGTNETLASLDAVGAVPGDQLALRWFPGTTLAQYEAGASPTDGDYFGTYSPDPPGSAPDGGSAWTAPDRGLVNLALYTSDSDLGGSQLPSAGFAGLQVTGAVPEPSIWSLLAGGVLLLAFAAKRLKTPDVSL